VERGGSFKAFEAKDEIPAEICYDGVYSGSSGMKSFFVSFGSPWQYQDNYGGMMATPPVGRDRIHHKSVLRSLPFVVTANSRISLKTRGGHGKTFSVEAQPAEFSGLATSEGFIGAAVRNIRTNRWVVSKTRLFSVDEVETLTFTQEELRPFVGEEVTVDIIDTFAGVWGWIAVDDFVLQGTCRYNPMMGRPTTTEAPQKHWAQSHQFGSGNEAAWAKQNLGDVCAYLDSPMDMATFFDAIGTSWEWQHEHGGGLFNAHSGQRDKPHVKSILRSIPFTVNPQTTISIGTLGGTGYLHDVDHQLANYSGFSWPQGFVGVAIRNAETDHWIISKHRQRNDQEVEVIAFDRQELAVLTGRRVTIDLVDTYHGPVGWIAVHDLVLHGPCVGVHFKPRPTLAPRTTPPPPSTTLPGCGIDRIIARPSLFCFSVMSPAEKVLVTEQFARRAGIFACNEYAVISKIQSVLGKDPCGSDVFTWHIDVKAEKIGDLKKGATTSSYLNTATFLQAWDALFNSKKLERHEFIAKADPDCVFFPERLREHVKPLVGRSLFILNCDSFDGRMYGALEVFSTGAILHYKENTKFCRDMKWHAWGEDLYMESCMRGLGVSGHLDFKLVGDSRCAAAPCTDATRVAFHPYKEPQSYWKCWEQGHR